MPETGFRFPTTDAEVAVTGTAWVNPTNVQADDASVATCNITAKNTTGIREQGGYGFSTTLVPDNARIERVLLRVEWRVQTGAGTIGILGCRARIGTTDLTIHENAAEPTTLTTETFDITSETGWTPANLRDGTLKTRLEPRNGNDADNPVYEFDFIALNVVWQLSPTVYVPTSRQLVLSGGMVGRMTL